MDLRTAFEYPDEWWEEQRANREQIIRDHVAMERLRMGLLARSTDRTLEDINFNFEIIFGDEPDRFASDQELHTKMIRCMATVGAAVGLAGGVVDKFAASLLTGTEEHAGKSAIKIQVMTNADPDRVRFVLFVLDERRQAYIAGKITLQQWGGPIDFTIFDGFTKDEELVAFRWFVDTYCSAYQYCPECFALIDVQMDGPGSCEGEHDNPVETKPLAGHLVEIWRAHNLIKEPADGS